MTLRTLSAWPLGVTTALAATACGEAAGPTIATISVTPPAVTFAALGDCMRLTASAKSQDGSVLPGVSFTWASGDPAIASVNASGLARAVANGSTTITAKAQGVGTAMVVVAQVVTSVQVAPTTTTFSALGDSATLTAVARDARGNVVPNVLFTWQSSDSDVAVVRSTGVVIGVSNGSATVSAAVAGVTGAAVITVSQTVASIALMPDSATLAPNDTIRLMASPRDARGHAVAGRTIAWSSADTGVATVDTAGLVTAVASRLGPTSVRASTDGRSDSARVAVLVIFASIAAGRETCGLTSDGVAYCWGNIYYRPVIVSRTFQFSAVSVGGHVCGIAGGAGYCWGPNDVGQLGNGSTSPSDEPVLVAGGHAFSTLSAGSLHTCGLEGNSAFCWGDNINGAVGDSTAFNRSSPVPVAGGLSFKSVSAGDGHTCAVSTGDSGYCWGYLQAAPNAWFSKLSPWPVGGGLPFATVEAGKFAGYGLAGAACGLVSAGSVYCWGPIDDPQPITSSVGFTAVTVGGGHSCALTEAGAAYCWGANSYGQLGDGSMVSQAAPVAVSGELVFVALSAGETHTCGVTSSGAAYCWGNNADAQLGDGTTAFRPNPTRVLGSRP